jgi:hypothetical protein
MMGPRPGQLKPPSVRAVSIGESLATPSEREQFTIARYIRTGAARRFPVLTERPILGITQQGA